MTIPQILLTPPWQDKASRIKAPKLPETLVISELPKLFLKGNPVPLSDDNVQNFLGLLFKSDIKQWVEPLTDDSVKALLAKFEPNALHDFANALAKQVGIDWYGYAVLSPFDFATVENLRGFIDGKTEQKPTIFDKELSQVNLPRQLFQLLVFNYRMTKSRYALQDLVLRLNKGEKSRAYFRSEFLSELSEEMGLSLLELQDLLVPNFGFNRQGKQTWQLGGENYELCLDNYCHVNIYQDKELINTIPRMPKTADKIQWKSQISYYKNLLKQLEKVYIDYQSQIEYEFTWQEQRNIYHFKNNYLNHPLLGRLAQNIVWAVFNIGNPIPKFISAFIVNNDGSWLNSSYTDIQTSLFQDKQVSNFVIVPLHPAFITQDEQDAFSQMLLDFDIIQPYLQIELSVGRLTEQEKQNWLINRFPEPIDSANFYHLNKYQYYEPIYSENRLQEKGITLKDDIYDNVEILYKEPLEKLYYVENRPIEPIVIPKNYNPIMISNIIVNLT